MLEAVVFKTNSEDEDCGWDFRHFWQEGRDFPVNYGDVQNGPEGACGGRAFGAVGWQDRIYEGLDAWWYESNSGIVYAWQSLAGWVEQTYYHNAIPCIESASWEQTQVRRPKGTAMTPSWRSLGLPSLSMPNFTVVELGRTEARRWNRLVGA